MLETFSQHRRFVVTGLLVLFLLLFLGLYRETDMLNPVLQSFIVSIIFFLVIPVFYCKMVLKEPLNNIGWHTGSVAKGVLASIISVILAGAIVVGLSQRFPTFQEEYVLPVLVEMSFMWFMLYELLLVALTVLLYEVLFRGLIQLLWLKSWGVWSIVVQAALFTGLMYVNEDVTWQTAPLIIFSPLAGFIAYRSQSIWYSWAASWTFLFLTDIFFLVSR